MQERDTFLIVDQDPSRRAKLCFSLSSDSIHAEPCEKLGEYGLPIPSRGKIIAHDTGSSISEIAYALRAQGTWLPIIAYADSPNPEKVADAIRAGASDYLQWPIDMHALVKRLVTIDLHAQEIEETRRRQAQSSKQVQSLSKREAQVLGNLSAGQSNKEIARSLSISHRTVEIHRANMLRKLGVNSSAEAIRIAVEAGPRIKLSQ